MPKFFVEQEQIENEEIKIMGQDVNHIKNVLRLEVGDNICICEKETAKSYNCRISQIEKDLVICKKLEDILESSEANTYIHIFQGLPKADKLEFIIEKCTEIGVKEITPVIMKRTIVRLDDKDKIKKISRWRKIAEVAAKQSGRDKILKVNDIINFENIFEKFKEYDIVLIAYENEKNNTLKNALKKINKEKENLSIAVLIGPEGGIENSEIELLKTNSKFDIITLGKRILRTETAPLVVSSNILYEMEE